MNFVLLFFFFFLFFGIISTRWQFFRSSFNYTFNHKQINKDTLHCTGRLEKLTLSTFTMAPLIPNPVSAQPIGSKFISPSRFQFFELKNTISIFLEVFKTAIFNLKKKQNCPQFAEIKISKIRDIAPRNERTSKLGDFFNCFLLN